MKKVLKGFGIILLAAFIVFFGIVAYFKISRAHDFKLQRSHVEAMKQYTETNYDEENFTAFSLDTDIHLNEIQLIATHNSYKKRPNQLGIFFVSLYDGKEPSDIIYEHAPLTDQFNRGVRGIELDVRKRGNRLELTHVPLVDNRATSPDFTLALEEIKHWSDNNADHVPLMIMLELKSDWEMLDPWLKPIDKAILDEINETIQSVFSEDQLLCPDDVRAEGKTLEESITTNGWPKLQDTQGKVMFIMLPNKSFRDMYHDGHESLEGRMIFTSSKQVGEDTAVIFMDNPDVEKITMLVEKNYIVRTRADANMIVDDTRTQNAKASGAQILSTDYPPGEADVETGYVCSFDGKMVRLNPVLCD